MTSWAIGLAASAAAFPAARYAAAQCDPTVACTTAAAALFVGDLNADERVNSADLQVFQQCFAGTVSPACPQADFNFDGVIDEIDEDYLTRIISLSGTGGAPALPRVTISELRVRKPAEQTNSDIPQSRYVEIRTPELTFTVNAAVPGNSAVTAFKDGWFYLKICRSGPGTGGSPETIAGTIAVVQHLSGMRVIRPDTPNGTAIPFSTRGLSLLVDESFAPPLSLAVPEQVRQYQFTAGGSLAIPTGDLEGRRFPVESETNVTHLVVYRNPSTSNPRDFPEVGQRVNSRLTATSEDCRLAFDLVGADLPPWDAVVDAVTLVKGASVPVYGCIFAEGPAALGPVNSTGGQVQPPHLYRCRNAGTLREGVEAVVFIPSQPQVPASDTPFARNPLCTVPVTNCGELGGNGQPRSCFDLQAGPFCSDPDCCIAVCALDPTCCTDEWGPPCAALAATTCQSCGLTTASCFVVHPTPACDRAECCDAVCAVPAFSYCCDIGGAGWDAGCVQEAKRACLGCGGLGVGPCDQQSDLPYCDDGNCCQRVCDVLPTCCTERWDRSCVDAAIALCPGCGRPGTGPCCVIHGSPYCENVDCCQAVCAIDPFCCSQSWDFFCTRTATAVVECEGQGCSCGNPAVPDAVFDCFTPHALAGCEDAFCCQRVCLADPYCCFIRWDEACVDLTVRECATDPRCIDQVTLLPVTGSCFIPRPESTGCERPACCSLVCSEPEFSYCCDQSWDEACAVRATDVCDLCGDPIAGSCFQSHVGPYCANAECCRTVCNFDQFCCEGTWDALCVQTAEILCGGPVGNCQTSVRSCWIPNYLPGCTGGSYGSGSGPPCCETICLTIDPFCCDARWDAVCAREASALCVPDDRPDVPVGPGSCLEPHGTPACSNEECARAVCTVDPSCCATGGAWDVNCVLAAMAVCPAAGGCPAEGNCFVEHPETAGCRDASCCNGVCSIDPACCGVSWDTICADIAEAVCKVPPKSGWSCPCSGSCFEPHDNPGCNDGSCCAVVCNINPACCEISWSADCTSFARAFCCGSPGCDSGCNGGCLTAHEEPYCNDPYCCDAVCRADPLCCISSWDSLCVDGALERCIGACGLQSAGDCFVPKAFGGCAQASCCAAVCAIDPPCCSVEWDTLCVEKAAALPRECTRKACGDFDAGPSCVAHGNGASDNEPCCTSVCLVDPYCCETEWDDACVDIALGLQQCECRFECGDECAGDCCTAHDNPSCNDEECCNVVCGFDPYCCDIRWDSACAAEAREYCNGQKDACPLPPCGSDLLSSCCVVSSVPNCNNEDCCSAVCQVDTFCCEFAWDVQCTEIAFTRTECDCNGPTCGDPNAGSCTAVHSDPFCSDKACCVFVCDLDASCCALSWDENCVSLALGICDPATGGQQLRKDPTARDRPGYTPPAGWMPVRQRLQQRRPFPADIDADIRPATEAAPIPRPATRSPAAKPGPAPAPGPSPGSKAPAAPGPGPTQGSPAAAGAPAAKKPGK